MKSTKNSFLFKTLLLSGALFAGWAANAQSTDPSANNPATDTARPNSMHRPMHRRPDGEGPGGGKEGFRRGGPEGFGGPGAGRGKEGFGFRGGERGKHHGFGEGAPGVRYTPEQRKQLMAINKEYHQKETDLFAKDNISLKDYKAGLVALHKEKKSKLEALLTPTQKEQIAKHKKMAGENQQVMAAAHMERLKLRLNLTDDQVARIKTGQQSLHQQLEALHENDNILPQQKMQQMKDLMAKRNDIYKSVLTPEQYSQFEKMSRHGRG